MCCESKLCRSFVQGGPQWHSLKVRLNLACIASSEVSTDVVQQIMGWVVQVDHDRYFSRSCHEIKARVTLHCIAHTSSMILLMAALGLGAALLSIENHRVQTRCTTWRSYLSPVANIWHEHVTYHMLWECVITCRITWILGIMLLPYYSHIPTGWFHSWQNPVKRFINSLNWIEWMCKYRLHLEVGNCWIVECEAFQNLA